MSTKFLISLGVAVILGRASAFPFETAKIEAITGLKGQLNQKEGVFKITSPRTDVKLKVDRWSFPPFMGATSWVGYQAGKEKAAMIMGDLVLFQDEVNPVMSALLEHSIDVTALHNHFFFEEPKFYFMHINGEGDPEALSKGVRAALDKVKEIRAKAPVPATHFSDPPVPSPSSITAKPIEQVLGQTAESKEGMAKITIGRTVKMPCGCEVGKTMGVNTWAAFGGKDADAVVMGDFAALETELQGVLKALRAAGINIVAIHSHMTQEEPRMLFVHYWGRGSAVDLAKGVKSAVDTQKGT